MSVVAEFSVTPVGTGTSVSQHVAHAVEVVQSSGLEYKLCPMGTVVAGELDQVLDVIKQCQQRLAGDCSRMIISVRMDWRKDREARIDDYVEHVQAHMAGHEAKA